MSKILVDLPNLVPRPYQEQIFDYWIDATEPGMRSVDVWARRMGKDLCYMSVAASKSYERKGLYLHFLPEFAHARRTLWDGFTNDGDRIIDVAFPPELRTSINEQEMRIELKNGAVWQLGGSDQYDRWVGSNPIGIVYSEFALAQPKGWELMRPILKINGGWAAFISTPRGYNHLHTMLQLAKQNPSWRWSHISATEADMGNGRTVMTMQDIEEEIAQGMPEELARQEYLCDFSAANVGAVLGRYIEQAGKEGRIRREVRDVKGERIDLSADIGFRDTAAFWFWQSWYEGFGLIDYDEDNGLDAQQWIERLAAKPYLYGTIYLPHDARAKTFATRHSVIEQFLAAVKANVLDAQRIEIVPQVAIKDRINAARTLLPRCHFDEVACAQGLMSLREWSYHYDGERKTYSREPEHNWASHGADAFTYGALKLRERVRPAPRPRALDPTRANNISLNDLWAEREHSRAARERIA